MPSARSARTRRSARSCSPEPRRPSAREWTRASSAATALTGSASCETSIGSFRAVGGCLKPVVAAVNRPGAGRRLSPSRCSATCVWRPRTRASASPSCQRGIPPELRAAAEPPSRRRWPPSSRSPAGCSTPPARPPPGDRRGRPHRRPVDGTSGRAGPVGSPRRPARRPPRPSDGSCSTETARSAISSTRRSGCCARRCSGTIRTRPLGSSPAPVKLDRVERLRLIRHSFPDQPELSTGDLAHHPGTGGRRRASPTIRIHRPGNEVAFGRQDIASPGYGAAAEAARAAGFAAVERLAGGRAAVFHQGTIAIARAYADPQPPKRTYARFEEMAGPDRRHLRGLGVDAPGSARSPASTAPAPTASTREAPPSSAGIGQRMIQGGAHMGGSGGRIGRRRGGAGARAGLQRRWSWTGTPRRQAASPRSSAATVDVGELQEALIAELAKRYELVDAELDEERWRPRPAVWRRLTPPSSGSGARPGSGAALRPR